MKQLLPFLLLLTLISCNGDLVYSENAVIENAEWSYNNPVSFSFEIPDTLQKYDLVLKIDHEVEFSNQNFYTQFTTTYPDGKEIKDIVSMELSSNYGQWMGDCTSENCQIEILLKASTRFKQNGTHQISIAQHTREEVLYGIKSLEFNLYKTKQ